MSGSQRYEDIIGLAHPVSARRKRMSALDRAAQFAPFAALTGYEAAVKEKARRTQRQIELDEDSMEMLNRRLKRIAAKIADRPQVTITFFEPDEQKNGGAYRSVAGCVRRIDECRRVLILTDRTEIPINRIYRLEENPKP